MADDSEQIGQDEIEELLRQSQAGKSAPKPAAAKTPDEGAALGQAEIEALLKRGAAQSQATAPQSTATASKPTPTATASKGRSVTGDDVQLLLAQAEQALASVDQPTAQDVAGLTAYELRDFAGSAPNTDKATIELLRDVELDLKIELGRTNMYLEDVLKLRKGSVVALDKLAGDPVEVYVNGRLIARGEVLVLNDNFCVRVAELLAGEDAA
jgi:flagellar motor switch protein FliN/FliY